MKLTFDDCLCRIGDAKNAFLNAVNSKQTDSEFEMIYEIKNVVGADMQRVHDFLKISFNTDFDEPVVIEHATHKNLYTAFYMTLNNSKLTISITSTKAKYHAINS